MYRGLSIGVVIPAFNEERAIAEAIRTVPSFVDRIYVIDDASADSTGLEARSAASRRVEVLHHSANRGVGAAIISGYRAVLRSGIDVAAVMAGDGQMDPADLGSLLDPIVDGQADYVKGNRFLRSEVWREMPPMRILGNVVLSTATRLTSGYHHVFDSQCGYTAITRATLARLDLGRVFARYGYPNDLLARLHAIDAKVVDVPVAPIYGANWKSGISVRTAVYPIAYVLLKSYLSRVSTETGARVMRRLTES